MARTKKINGGYIVSNRTFNKALTTLEDRKRQANERYARYQETMLRLHYGKMKGLSV